MGPRYDAAYGLLLLVLPTAVVVGLGDPLDRERESPTPRYCGLASPSCR